MAPMPRLKRYLLAALALPAFIQAVPAQAANPELCRLSFSSGAHLLVPVARTWQEQQEGLANRLDAGPGLLFLWEQSAVRTLWMKNTYIPLSAAFIHADGEIQDIVDMDTASEDLHRSSAPVSAALELARGDFQRHGIKAGDKVDIRCARPGP